MMVALLFQCSLASAQGRGRGRAKAKTAVVLVKATIADEKGNPIEGAKVIANEGVSIVKSDDMGSFEISTRSNTPFLIEAEGYDTYVSDPKADNQRTKFVLVKPQSFGGEEDYYNLPNNLTQPMRRSVSAISKASGEETANHSELLYSNALQGKLAGLTASFTQGGIQNNPASLKIRGLHTSSSNGVLVLIDGVPRSINDILPSEVESIEVLKDATAKIIYGAMASNGAIVVTTKKGESHKRVMKVNVDMGSSFADKYPGWLNSYDYATLYNEARENDGLAPIYSAADLEGYRNSMGANDVRYPDVDYYDYFLRNNLGYRRVDFEFSGGNENTKYALIAGYTGKDALQKVGEKYGVTRFNVRGNLDMKVNDMISAYMGIAAQLESDRSSAIDHSSTFAQLSTTRPNEYPLIIANNIIPVEANGYPALGAALDGGTNLYGEFVYGGHSRAQSTVGQLQLGLNFDFDDYVEGLNAKVMMSLDNYFSGTEKLNTGAPTYAQRWSKDADGNDFVEFIQKQSSSVTDQQTLSNSFTYRTTSWLGNINYDKEFGDDHSLSLNALGYYYVGQATGATQNTQTSNFMVRANYAYNDRYVAELSGAVMGSSRFDKAHRHLPTFALGAGWIFSEESFMSDIDWVDFAKVKISGGLLGYDGGTGYRLYEDRYNNSSTNKFNNSLNPALTQFTTVGNDDLRWEKSAEVNVGVEALVLDGRLGFEINYFNEYRYDIIKTMGSEYSELYGTVFSQDNLGEVRNSGFDLSANWCDKIDELTIKAGLNMVYSKNKVLRANEVIYSDSFANQTGASTDALFGYVARGLYGRDVELAGSPIQTFGEYGEGDIAYEDLNGDGYVDSKDRKVLGNSHPRVELGIDVDLNYKGFGLYALATAQLGVQSFLNNDYFWCKGEGKYSDLTMDRYHPENNPEGDYPRLTTTSGANNFVNSSRWIEDTGYLRLKNVEFSYTFGYDKPILKWLKSVKLYVRANNMLTLSKVENFDPELLNGSVTNYPVLKTVTGGATITF